MFFYTRIWSVSRRFLFFTLVNFYVILSENRQSLHSFIHSHARCGSRSIVCLRFQVVQTKQVDCKMSTRNVNKTFRDIFGQLHTQEYKATKEKMLRLQLNEKNAKESQTRLMTWYWIRKSTWRNDLTTYNSHPCFMLSIDLLVITLEIRDGEEEGLVWNW